MGKCRRTLNANTILFLNRRRTEMENTGVSVIGDILSCHPVVVAENDRRVIFSDGRCRIDINR